MPLFQYQALDQLAKKRSGSIEAVDAKDAKLKLRDQGLMVSTLVAQAAVSSKQNLSGDILVAFTAQLSQLINARVPLYQSLSAMEEQYRGEAYHRIILSLCDQIKAGKQLSEAFASFPESFDSLYCSMIAAGESAGALDIVLERLSQLLEKQNKLKRQMITALIYPGVLAVFSLVIIALLVGFVVPSIEGIFAGKQLNSFTNIVLKVSGFLRNYWWVYFPILVLACFIGYKQFKSAQGKIWLEKNLLKVPIIKTLMVQAAVARFSRTMATLQAGGLTIIDSLRLARKVIGNAVLEKEIESAEHKIIEGSSLSSELMHSRWFPKMVSRMLAVGEDSGSTTIMFNKIADVYEQDIEKTLNRVMALAQPIILIVMGSVIGVVLLAILLPMTDFSSFAAN